MGGGVGDLVKGDLFRNGVVEFLDDFELAGHFTVEHLLQAV